MPAYDEHFFTPPAPLAQVTLRHPENGTTVSDVPMLLDSGAEEIFLTTVAAGSAQEQILSGPLFTVQTSWSH